MDLKSIQKIVRDKYYEIDSKSGELFLLSVLFEEVGELAEAVRKRDRNAVKEELVDVLFMVISIANLFNVELEDRLIEKYIKGDPSSRWDLPHDNDNN